MAAQRGPRDFGGTLRAARERRGLSLRQIASATKISMITLEALERNDLARLPGGIFSRAFVRSYALEVGLDPATAIQDFMGQFPQDSVTAGQPIASQIEDHEAVESDRRAASTLLRLVTISVPIAAVVVYFGMLGRPASPREELPHDAAAAVPEIAPVPAAQLDPARASVGTPAAAPGAVAVPADRLMVQILATKSSWVSAIVDGRQAVQRTFQPGDEQTFEVHKEIALTAGDAGGVAMMFNGMAAKPLGAAGKAVTVHVNLTNFKEYLLAP
jgi:cytoskeletal protein RodZ